MKKIIFIICVVVISLIACDNSKSYWEVVDEIEVSVRDGRYKKAKELISKNEIDFWNATRDDFKNERYIELAEQLVSEMDLYGAEPLLQGKVLYFYYQYCKAHLNDEEPVNLPKEVAVLVDIFKLGFDSWFFEGVCWSAHSNRYNADIYRREKIIPLSYQEEYVILRDNGEYYNISESLIKPDDLLSFGEKGFIWRKTTYLSSTSLVEIKGNHRLGFFFSGDFSGKFSRKRNFVLHDQVVCDPQLSRNFLILIERLFSKRLFYDIEEEIRRCVFSDFRPTEEGLNRVEEEVGEMLRRFEIRSFEEIRKKTSSDLSPNNFFNQEVKKNLRNFTSHANSVLAYMIFEMQSQN